MVDVAKREGFTMGLEHIQSIYERLIMRGKLSERCKSCPVMIEASKLLEYSKEMRVEELEQEIGYHLI